MTKVSEIVEPYFSHDIASRQDRDIILLLDEMGYEGYGLFWAVVEFMHRNKLRVGEERLIAGKDYAEKVTHILNDFELFRIEDGEYISDRILRNINKQTEKSKKASAAINALNIHLTNLFQTVYKTELFSKLLQKMIPSICSKHHKSLISA